MSETKIDKNGEKRKKIRYRKGDYFLCAEVKIMSKKRKKCRCVFIAEEKMSRNLTAEQVLEYLIETLETNLSEILGAEYKNEFVVGEWYAYIECLEAIFYWDKAKKFGLNYDPESKYKIS